MKKIAVDMDGVLANVYELYHQFHERDFGKRKLPEEIMGIPEGEAFPTIRQFIYETGFFLNVPVIEGSQEVMRKLNQQYELYIVSAATEFPKSLPEKQTWLGQHFPFISWQQMVFCGSKKVIKADIMIDDHFKNLDYFEGQTLLFTQPHNCRNNDHQHTRVDSWSAIEKLLL
ncbi:5'(3')-deoxyribonucleotidase [Mucilaginibacter sp. Bleaf8]|uniref:5' nucleotidase, NT5C type n=1 Tax=Mucilaginibacter sp. Bleaf8 TaxID=2834430 RepID=UPI001BCF30E9|nr:5'(3')-deoxyribonucleotidase [Mucilaginibacter sp. Bleaf8]MBS7565015.1 5'(3')-deoxyribonucleotidase [Mucilaginibacter sp. Bleaf8]